MEKKFNVGDRVMCTDNGALGVITSIDIDPIGVCDGYTVLFDDGEETWICADMVVHSDEPPYDPKTAFLSELKGLLEKYGACIYDDEQYKLIIEFNNGDSLEWKWSDKSYDESKLTPDNIMEYDKE